MKKDALLSLLGIVGVTVIIADVWWWQNSSGLPEQGIDDMQTGNDDIETHDLITVSFPIEGDTITNPLTVHGEARGNWYFEATFPVRVEDQSGAVLGQHYAQAMGEWMTEAFVPFEGVVDFTQPIVTTSGFVVFEKDNPSGLPEYADQVRIPVILVPATATPTMAVKVYFGNADQLQEGQDECTTVFALERQVPQSTAVGRAAVEELLSGPTATETAQGYSSSLPRGVQLQSLRIENGTAFADFSDALNRVGGSCRATAIRKQITETLAQFPTVDTVIISVNGNVEEALQP